MRSRVFPLHQAIQYAPLGEGGFDISAFCMDHIQEMPDDRMDSVQGLFDRPTGEIRLFHRVYRIIPREIDAFQVIEISEEPKKIMEEEYQLWRQGDPWYRYYQRTFGLPIKAEMIDCSHWQY